MKEQPPVTLETDLERLPKIQFAEGMAHSRGEDI